MRESRIRLRTWSFAIALIAVWFGSNPTANAFTYRSAYINSWSGCECWQDPLSYTSDQILWFNGAMYDHGHTALSTYVNQDVWSADITDEAFSGYDYFYSDDAAAWAYSGHGLEFKDGNNKQHFQVPFCNGGGLDCNMDVTSTMRSGEQVPAPNSSPYAGSMRWAILSTCFSVDTQAGEQWWNNMRYGTEYVVGFRGLSTDAEATDEFLEDFVEEAFAPNKAFKASWFYAVEDFWVDDTGGVISTGTSTSNAQSRRDNWNPNTTSRRAATPSFNYSAWSFHTG